MDISKLYIKATKNSPEVDFDPATGILFLNGKSIPENATKLYQPVTTWLKEYIQEACDETQLHFNLIYFNTASSIWMARMIKILSLIESRDKLFVIHLYFHIEEFEEMEDEDIKDVIAPASDVLHEATVSLGVKIYGIDDFGNKLKEKLVLF